MHRDEVFEVFDFGLSARAPLYVQSHIFRAKWSRSRQFEVHEGLEVGIVLRGRQERHWQGLTHEAQPGDFWLCANWEPHGYRMLEPGTEDIVVIFLPGYLGDEMFGDMPWLSLFTATPERRPGVGDVWKRERLLALGREMAEESQGQGPGWESGLRLALLRALFVMSRNWEPSEASGAFPHAGPARLARIMPALELVHAQPIPRVSIARAADACFLGRTQFCTLFRQNMGMGFGEFCLRARLTLAAKRLVDTDAAAEAIAKETGFSGASHLHRSFQKRYGCSPASYRRQMSSGCQPGGG